MATNTLLSPDDIKERLADLNAEAGSIALQVENARRRKNVIDEEIASLQQQCPHLSTTSYPVIDGPGVKNRDYCDFCGKRV